MDKNATKAYKLTQEGVNFANQGQIEKAIPCFKKSLVYAPNANTYYLLALAYQMIGKITSAEKNYLQAISFNPQFSMAYNNLGAIYLNLKDYHEAIKCFSQAISTDPNNSFAYNNLGNAYKDLDEKDKAIKNYKLALKVNPKMLDSYNNLGVISFDQGKYLDAIKYLNKALKIDPDYSPCRFHLAIAYAKNNDLPLAIENLVQYSKLVPDDDKALSILANLYHTLQKTDLSLNTFKKVLSINPRSTHALNDLGNIYKEMGDLEKAKKYYQKALKYDSGLAGTYNNLGVIYLEQGKPKEALENLNKAIEIDRQFAMAYYHRGLIYEKRHQLDMAIDDFRAALRINNHLGPAQSLLVHALKQSCYWKKFEKEVKVLDKLTKDELEGKSKTISDTPFLNVIRNDDLSQNQKIAIAQSAVIENNIGYEHPYSYPTPKKKKVLRIGYLSADFFDHATVHLTLGLFKTHSREKFTVYAYSYGIDDGSKYRQQIQKDCDVFRDINSLGFRQAADKIYQDQIDILVDLKGHTRNNRLEIAAYRPAPIQVSYLGFPGTTGATFMDYFITDRVVTPLEYGQFFSEKLVFLPNSYQVNNDQREIADITYNKSDFGLPENAFVFCSFNHTYKIDSGTFKSWVHILSKVPNGVLWLLKSNSFAVDNLRKEAISNGIDPNRLIFSPLLPNPSHLARLKLSDLALDPFICNGHTTTSDFLWAGVPVITLKGKHFASRVAASLVSAVDLPELATDSPKEYEKLAIHLATNPSKLKIIKDFLVQNRKTFPLFETKRFVTNLEKAYLMMWDIYSKNEKPHLLEVKED